MPNLTPTHNVVTRQSHVVSSYGTHLSPNPAGGFSTPTNRGYNSHSYQKKEFKTSSVNPRYTTRDSYVQNPGKFEVMDDDYSPAGRSTFSKTSYKK